jgi:hypothetical protein
MLYYPLYRASAEIYLLAKVIVAPTICLLGWLLLGRAAAKHLHSYVYWFLPSMIGASLNVAGLLLETYLNFYARRDYALITAVYMIYLAAVPFHLVSFTRLWKTITALPPGAGEQPPPRGSTEQDESVWPPQPRR